MAYSPFSIPTTGTDPKVAAKGSTEDAINDAIEAVHDDLQTHKAAANPHGATTTNIPEGTNKYLTVDNFEAMVNGQTEYEGLGNDDRIPSIVSGVLRWIDGTTIGAAIWDRLGGLIASGTEKGTPVDADKIGYSDSAASSATKRMSFAQLAAYIWSKTGPSIAGATAKGTLVSGDSIAISDSANSGVSRKALLSSVAAYHWTQMGSLIAGGTNKTTLAGGDRFVISDSQASNASKRVSFDQFVASMTHTAIPGLSTALAGKADTSHSHSIANVTGLQTALDGKAATSHNHSIANVTGLQTALDAKAASSHTHTAAQVSGLSDAVLAALKATESQAAASGLDDKFVTPKGLRGAENAISQRIEQRLLFEPRRASGGFSRLPGVDMSDFARDFNGPPATLLGFDLKDQSASADGQVLRLYGDDIVSMRGLVQLVPGRKYRVTARLRRYLNSSDPLNDDVQLCVAWLDNGMASDGMATPVSVLESDALVAADGLVTWSGVIASADGDGVDAFNPNAVYARAFIRIYGGDLRPATDVQMLWIEDITNVPVTSGDLSAYEDRIEALEAGLDWAAVQLSSGADLNTYTTPGPFVVASPTNAPSGAAARLLGNVFWADASTMIQEVWEAEGSLGRSWWRARTSGTWQAWQKRVSEAELSATIQSLANSLTTTQKVEHSPAFVNTGAATGFAPTHTVQKFSGYLVGSATAGYWLHFQIGIRGTLIYSAHGGVGLRVSLPYACDLTEVDGFSINVRPNAQVPFPRHASDVGLIGGLDAVDADSVAIGFERNVPNPDVDVRFYALSEFPSGTELGLTLEGKYKVVGI